jgi:hypothetical protein
MALDLMNSPSGALISDINIKGELIVRESSGVPSLRKLQLSIDSG